MAARVRVGCPVVTVRLGVLVLPERPGPDGLSVWRHVEDLGVRHAWTYDHLRWGSLPDHPWFDAMTTLAAAATVTDRIELGTLVASPNFRHPVSTAAQAMTLDQLSGGRFVLGMGSGADGPDATLLGGPRLAPRQRADRFAEFVSLADATLRGRRVTTTGRYYAADGVRLVPGCVRAPRVPFAIAATGRRGMRLAAEHGQFWVTIGAPGMATADEAFHALADQLTRLDAACAEAGRDRASLRTLVNLSRIVPDPYTTVGRLRELLARCEDLGFTDAVVAYPRADGVFAGDQAAFERAVATTVG